MSRGSLLVCIAVRFTAMAQNYPQKPVRLIVRCAGQRDRPCRAPSRARFVLAHRPATFVVEDRPGATGRSPRTTFKAGPTAIPHDCDDEFAFEAPEMKGVTYDGSRISRDRGRRRRCRSSSWSPLAAVKKCAS